MYNPNLIEKEMLEYWEKNDIFKKSVSERSVNKTYAFYDGPPFATGLPHYGHIMAGTKKDTVPRYFTMRGYRVERRWGWDCHGLPIENLIEKELKISGPREIREYGIDRFNEACRAKVFEYADEWKKIIPRMGRWVDMDTPYTTMDMNFMESVWWVFAELWKKGLVYEGYKAMHICPRCVTPLSNFEVTQGYKDVTDISVTARFRVTNAEQQLGMGGDVFALAWTTTPWTLPGNVLLAINPDINYSLVQSTDNAWYIVASDLVHQVFAVEAVLSKKELKGSELVGLTYEPLFPYFAGTANAFRVVPADFVTTEDGTGIVHIAPAFGEDDYGVGEREGVLLVQHVTMEGKFVETVADFAGLSVKPKDDPTATDVEIIKWLAHAGKLHAKKKFSHSYPHCWRCDSPLLNYATSSWFVKVTAIQQALLDNNEAITWIPDHMKYGRFGKWLEGAKDWSISRNRFWGTTIPVWKCQNNSACAPVIVGSVAELEKLSGQAITDLHKHKIDGVTMACPTCSGTMQRVPEVLDTWFDSGSVPYGQYHYPFENKETFASKFPADFIAESQDQTRGWFYTLHVLATALTMGREPSVAVDSGTSAFKTVSVNGIILAEDGQKMSKRLKNYPDPMEVVEKYGADALRYYFLSSPVMHGETLNFSETTVREIYNKVVNTLWNVFEFYRLFAEESRENMSVSASASANVLDQWIVAKLNVLVKDVTANMDACQIAEAARPIVDFVTELSQWYVRRSRDRFKGDDAADKAAALATLRHVLLTLAKVMAPFTPFVAEKLYGDMRDLHPSLALLESVHLEAWPGVENKLINNQVLVEMDIVRKIVEAALALRAERKIKVRQPLQVLEIHGFVLGDKLSENIRNILIEELNLMQIEYIASGESTAGYNFDTITKYDNFVYKDMGTFAVGLDTAITPELKVLGLVRDVVRAINQLRKDAGLSIHDRVRVSYATDDPELNAVFTEYAEQIKGQVLADALVSGAGAEVKIGDKTLSLGVEKV